MGTGGGLLLASPQQARRTKPRSPRVEPPSQDERILSLQQSAGNAAVSTLVQRQPTATTAGGAASSRATVRPFDLSVQTKKAPPKPRPKAKKATIDNHVALINALEWLGANWPKIKEGGVIRRLNWLTFGLDTNDLGHLLPQHMAMLNEVVDALITRTYDEWAAYEKWQNVSPRLRTEASNMFTFMAKYPKADLTETRRVLPILESDAFPVKNAYAALRSQKKQERRPHAPDAVKLSKLPELTQAFFETNKLYEDTAKLASTVVSVDSLRSVELAKRGVPAKHVGALIDILSSTKSLDEKLAEARKKLDVFSAADLLNKVAGLTSGTMGATAAVGEQWAAKMVAKSLASQAAKDVTRYKHVLAKFQNLGEMAGKVGDAATAISVATNYIKFVKAIWERKWEDVLSSGADLGLDLAGVALGGGAAGGAMIAGSVIVVKAQLEAIHLAAEFIRWCKDETVRQAAEKFVKDATTLAKGPAWDLVANAEIILDPSKEAVHEIANQQMEINARNVAKGLRHLDTHVSATVKTAIGGHPAVRAALGDAARNAMAFPADDVLNIADQVDVVFKGVDNMARFVKATYTN